MTDLQTVPEAIAFHLLHSQDLVSTLRILQSQPVDVAVVQLLSTAANGFELEKTLEVCRAQDTALILVFEDGQSLLELSRREDFAELDFLLQPIDPKELMTRVQLSKRRHYALRKLTEQVESHAELSLSDFKTGLFNDRFFQERLLQELQRSARHHFALSLVLFDFDNFKEINDGHSHIFGDYVLREFSHRLQQMIRQIDIAARLGGDEFALLLPNTDLEEATVLASRIRRAVASEEFRDGNDRTKLLVSMGIHGVAGGDTIDSEEFMRCADLALLEAKRRGKNRVCLYSELIDNEPPLHQAAGAG